MHMKKLKILIAEDEAISREVLKNHLQDLGGCELVVDGIETLSAVKKALKAGTQFDLICLDIKMPFIDGMTALKDIRHLEEEYGILPGDGAKIVMTTADDTHTTIMESFREQCESYIIKPVMKDKLMDVLKRLGLVG